MFVGLLFLSMGCTVRVGAEVLAYQEILPAACGWLPYSAIFELAAVTALAVNLIATFLQPSTASHSPARNFDNSVTSLL